MQKIKYSKRGGQRLAPRENSETMQSPYVHFQMPRLLTVLAEARKAKVPTFCFLLFYEPHPAVTAFVHKCIKVIQNVVFPLTKSA